jgi:hypothetical protein
MSPQEQAWMTAVPAQWFGLARPARDVLRVRVLLPSAAVILGALQAWAVRHNPAVGDAVSYLDMGDAFAQGRWDVAINGYWSPLYAWLVGVAQRVLHPSPYWEFGVVRLVNLAVYLVALVAFEGLLHQVLRLRRAATSPDRGAAVGIGEAPLRAIAYAAFLWASLDLIKLSQISPDMCVAAAVYAATGLLLRIGAGDGRPRMALALGGVLGLGYLAKAPMFPLAFVFLILCAAVSYRRPWGWVTPTLAGLTFLLLATPLITALSRKVGHLSFGESGRLNYAWYVAGVPSRHWQGGDVGGIAQHPTQLLLQQPEAYRFGRPNGVTYPLWYDPTFWYAGLKVPISVTAQLRASAATIGRMLSLLFGLGGSLLFGVIALTAASGRGWRAVTDFRREWLLWAPALAAALMYALVHVENRHIAPFLVLGFLAAYAAVRVPPTPASRRLARAVAALAWLMLLSPIGPSHSPRYVFSALAPARNEAWEIAEGMRRFGVRTGAPIATMSYANLDQVAWARLARVQVVAEVYDRPERPWDNDFWVLPAAEQLAVLRALQSAGARYATAVNVPPWITPAGWTRIPGTAAYMRTLGQPEGEGRL